MRFIITIRDSVSHEGIAVVEGKDERDAVERFWNNKEQKVEWDPVVMFHGNNEITKVEKYPEDIGGGKNAPD